jgi:RNA polymerase sigma-70 factor (ECF subfamily)
VFAAPSGWPRSAQALVPTLARQVADLFARFAGSVGQDAGAVRTQQVRSDGIVAGGEPLSELTEFVRTHHARLIRLATLVCRSSDDADDAVQAALERAWRHQDALRDPERFKPWLDRIVVREAARISGRRGQLLRRFMPWRELDQGFDPPDPSDLASPFRLDIHRAFEQLSVEQRTVVALHLYAGYTVEETAGLVGAPVETVRSRLRLARQRLRRELEASP